VENVKLYQHFDRSRSGLSRCSCIGSGAIGPIYNFQLNHEW